MNNRSVRALLRFGALCLIPGMAIAGPTTPQDPPAPAPTLSLDISITGIRKAEGVIRLALCAQQTGFPDCGARAIRTLSVEIEDGGRARISIPDLAPGVYAVSVFHDANENGKLDTFVGIPREGYGFSNNPPFRPRAPRFSEAELKISGPTATTIRLRYLF